MKKRMILGIAVFLAVASAAGAAKLADRFSLRLGPGAIVALGGRYTDTEKLSKIVNMGFSLSGVVRYKLNETVYFDAGYMFDWMSVKKAMRPFDYKEGHPALNLQMFTMNVTFFLSSGYLIEPFFTLGAGISPWRFSSRPFGGETWPAPANPDKQFSGTDVVLDLGFGIEAFLFKKFSAFLEFKYYYIFARDVGKFGTDDFTQQDFLGLGIGLNYDFKKK